MSDAAREEYKRIEEKRQDMGALFGRMDRDQDLYYLKPYQMMNLPPYQTKAMDDVANVTLNDPLLFATKSLAIMASAQMQTEVEGEGMEDKQAAIIEGFLDDIFYMVDERLVKRGGVGLDSFANEQVCMRGRVAARVCMRPTGDDGVIPDVLPIDTRHFVYETDEDGLAWGAATFRRSKAQILKEYGEEIQDDYADIIDYWDDTKEMVFADENVIREQKNPYGYPPFVFSICPVGSGFHSEAAMEHQGESIFWANRDLWNEKNRTATILQTLNILSLFPGLQYASTAGEKAAQPQDSPFGAKKVQPVEKGGGYSPMPVADIRAATRLFYAVLDASLQRGSLSVVDYGTLSFPLSAIAITRLSGSRDDIFLPRIQAKALFYQALSRMGIAQCVNFQKALRLGKPGSHNTYSPSDFEGDYAIKYRFFTESKEQEIADLQIASVAQQFMSSDTIRRDVLKLQDPEGEETKFLSEQAEKVDEVLFLYRRACRLIDDEKPLEAYILAKRIVSMLKQRQMMGQLEEAQAQATPAAKGEELLPLLGAGGGRGGASQSPVPTEPEERTAIQEGERE